MIESAAVIRPEPGSDAIRLREGPASEIPFVSSPKCTFVYGARTVLIKSLRVLREQANVTYFICAILGLIVAARAALRAFSQENILVPMHPHFGSIASEMITHVDLPACSI